MAFVYLSCNAYGETVRFVEEMGHTPVLLSPFKKVYPAVSCHADLFLCKLGVGAAAPAFVAEPLGYEYPECASNCAAVSNKYFIHNTRITNPKLLKKAEDTGLTIIHVNQGFTRCNLLPLGEGVITSDNGIAKTLHNKTDLDVLVISSGNVALEGHEYGFLPGCAGIVDDTVLFNGDLSLHPDEEKITEFIGRMGYKIKGVPNKILADIGSIIQLEERVNPFGGV